MSGKLTVGALIPNWYIGQPPTGPDISKYSAAAEDLGFDSIWAIDRLFGPHPVLEPYTVLTWAAASTTRVRIGSTVILAALRNPVWLAKEIATLDYMSGGRIDLGISLGGTEQAYTSVGVPMNQRAGRLVEGIKIMKKLWSEDNVTWQGKYQQLKEATILPKPIQKSIPILIGATNDNACARAGRIADGWIANAFSSPEQIKQRWQKVQDGAKTAGRDPGSLSCSKLLYLWVDDDEEKAKKIAFDFYQSQYPSINVMNFMACGPADKCSKFIQAYLDAGVTNIILGPTGLDIKQLETIKKDIVPKLHI
ncbi:MAG: LLM class flavin-dependent oxidoreductase [Dehalococcoidia bacterium]|nr:LLM class flavin-dependent oxidoreductase [Dehalococcoidia bacterium]